MTNVIDYIETVVIVASIIVAITPTPDPKTKLGKLYKLIEYAALNLYKAKEVYNDVSKKDNR